MKKLKALSVLLTLAVAGALTSGCQHNEGMTRHNKNFLGIVEVHPASYEEVDSTTFAVSSNEIASRRDFSGDNVSLLWGLVTYTDY